MRVPDDLHPDDTTSRTLLLNALRCSRKNRRITLVRIAALHGVSPPSIRAIEERTTWQAPTIMRYARAIGWRIQWSIADLTVPDDGDVLALILAAGDTSTPERADRVHWMTVCYDLVRVRRANLSAAAMGTRLRVTESAVLYWEGNFEGSSIVAAQRHARALGGRLCWDLHPAPSPLVVAVPSPRVA